MPNRIKKDRGEEDLEEVAETLEALGVDPRVTVGVHAQDSARPGDDAEDPPNNAALMAIHEFGRGVPARPILRPTIDEHEAEYEALMRALLGQVVDGAVDARSAMVQLGMAVKGDMQSRFGSSALKPNAPATIRRKGSAAPLIDDGHLRRSIDFEVDVDE